jgi:hypothetical protein
LLLSFISAAQDFEVPANLPKTKDEFVRSEPDFIAAAKWLESIPIGTQEAKVKKMNAWVVAWITNSPTGTVEIKPFVAKFYDKTHNYWLCLWLDMPAIVLKTITALIS